MERNKLIVATCVAGSDCLLSACRAFIAWYQGSPCQLTKLWALRAFLGCLTEFGLLAFLWDKFHRGRTMTQTLPLHTFVIALGLWWSMLIEVSICHFLSRRLDHGRKFRWFILWPLCAVSLGLSIAGQAVELRHLVAAGYITHRLVTLTAWTILVCKMETRRTLVFLRLGAFVCAVIYSCVVGFLRISIPFDLMFNQALFLYLGPLVLNLMDIAIACIWHQSAEQAPALPREPRESQTSLKGCTAEV